MLHDDVLCWMIKSTRSTNSVFFSYPVMIMQDAHNLFFEDLSFAGKIWEIQFTMDELNAAGIIKGIYFICYVLLTAIICRDNCSGNNAYTKGIRISSSN